VEGVVDGRDGKRKRGGEGEMEKGKWKRERRKMSDMGGLTEIFHRVGMMGFEFEQEIACG